MDLPSRANPVRFVTAARLFDGHDTTLDVMRRLLRNQGAEVIHLGHSRTVNELATAAIQEDAQGIVISSYQGGHVGYVSCLVGLLEQRGAEHVQVYAGGRVTPEEAALLRARGVTRIFSLEDGQHVELAGTVSMMIRECDVDLAANPPPSYDGLRSGEPATLARVLTMAEVGRLPNMVREWVGEHERSVPVLGIAGTGGSGKSSMIDELLWRLRLDYEDKLRIAVLAVGPTHRTGGGALLGDRIRMHALRGGDQVYFRSMATRAAESALPQYLETAIAVLESAGFDLVIVEATGIGQGDVGIVDFVDHSVYVTTPEFAAVQQLAEIAMLAFTDVVAINKLEYGRRGDARRAVARQLARSRGVSSASWVDMPVFGTCAATLNDDGVNALYRFVLEILADAGLHVGTDEYRCATGEVVRHARLR